MRPLTVTIALFSALVWAIGGRHDADGPARPDTAPGEARAFTGDSTAIRRYVESIGFSYDRIAARVDGYVAALATGGPRDVLHLIPLRVEADMIVQLKDPERMWGGFPPDVVEWLALDGKRIDALRYTIDAPVERIVGTFLYIMNDGRLEIDFFDDPYACKPADLRDLDADGTPELITHVEDPTSGDCYSLCLEALLLDFDFYPGWPRVHRRVEGRWIGAEADFPAFYSDAARRFERIANWVEGEGREVCGNSYWLRDSNPMRSWAARARALAENSARTPAESD